MRVHPTPSFTVGIEEEYLLVDRTTRDVVSDPPREIFEQCAAQAKSGVVMPELLRAQIEVDTHVCKTIAEARADLARLRGIVTQVAENFGLAPIAASTHPFAHWQVQRHTDKQRYQMLSRDMQSLARRMLICGMHVHVGIEDDELRVHLLNQFTHFLPLLLALSTSSPFWEGQKTGLMSYRLPVFDTFPRTGLPERFASFAEYQQQVAILQKSGIIEDATVIWWDLRPSARYPTLEMRITDVCTRLDDAASLAALTQCTLHHLYRLRMKHQSWQVYPRFLVDQNRWRAMRYGYDEGLVDFASGDVVPVQEMVIELVEMLREDAEALGCVRELVGVLEILKRGTSAHRQINVYEDSLAAGADEAEALKAVVDMLISESMFSVF
jgi:carboxylate-amine ligase